MEESKQIVPDAQEFEHYKFDHGETIYSGELAEESLHSAESRWKKDSRYLAVVPATRGAEAIAPLIGSLAKSRMPITVFVAHSDKSAQEETTPLLEQSGMDYVNAYIPPGSHVDAFGLKADTFPHAIEARTGNNLAFKRNVGLLLRSAVGAKGIIFLDDDIRIRYHNKLAWLLRHMPQTPFNLLGLANSGMPDRSVVHHALGLRTQPFISGQAMIVHPMYSNFGDTLFPENRHFPNIYNEDWLYMYEIVRGKAAARAGKVRQREYDPFLPGRPLGEEFGDTVAEGMYATWNRYFELKYWQSFLCERRQVIDLAEAKVITNVQLNDTEKQRRIAAIEQSRVTSRAIDAADCVEYVTRWQRDDMEWKWIAHKMKQSWAHMTGAPAVKQLFGNLDLPLPEYNLRETASKQWWVEAA